LEQHAPGKVRRLDPIRGLWGFRRELVTDLSHTRPFGAPDTTPTAEFSPPDGAMARVFPEKTLPGFTLLTAEAK
jgi:hypothetical protein